MKRLLVVLCLAAAIFVPSAAPMPAAASAPVGYVKWVVNHKKKTITATVKLAIYLGPCTPTTSGGGGGADCAASAARIASEIRGDIDAVWNNKRNGGYHYKCYRLIFLVDIVEVTDRFSVPGDRVGILIDRSGQGIRSGIRPTFGGGISSLVNDNYLSNDPADRAEPDNAVIDPSEFAYPPMMGSHSYAHEFGHVLGLDDYYVEGSFDRKPGAPEDLMANQRNANITQETIDRVIERNADRMVDTEGKPADLEKLVCDLLFRATLKADQVHYDASHLMDSIARPPCSNQPFTHSTDQTLRVDSQPVELQLVEAPDLAPLGYALIPTFDVLTLQNGLSQAGRPEGAVGMFDLPITVQVERLRNNPARGDLPPVLDLPAGQCSENEPGPRPAVDCGRRVYHSWMAVVSEPGGKAWLMPSSIPVMLRSLGYLSPRFDVMYRNCPGPTPWPGLFIEEGGAITTKGTMPALDALKKVSKDWYSDDVPGRVEMEGQAILDSVRAGSLENDELNWTLVLCPVNKDGQTPPSCP